MASIPVAWQPAVMTERDLDAVTTLEALVQAFPWSRGNFADSLGAGYEAWVLRHEEEPVAFAVLMYAPDVAHLLSIAVHPQWQGQGLGRILMDWCILLAGQRELPVLLEVRRSNERARAFYARCGFRQIGVRKGYYPAGEGMREDAHVLQLDYAESDNGE